ncbi:hypothetical protein DGM85_06815 [Xanthomonas phaseoli pv. phaseoli]|nr:hypothetical protein DGM93_15810 [Xanthomonas phaseoli pv. phaseoli]QWN28269.1 hypothetical protein DGM85_06815 [Xanthomonas phaseoli pv. phaseoli]QWN33884.1 hypothetical protein DGM81_15570 [Xanthomonas phaseoli pv. phaseoli]
MVQSCARFKRPLYYLLNTTCSVRWADWSNCIARCTARGALLRLLLVGVNSPDLGATCTRPSCSCPRHSPHCSRLPSSLAPACTITLMLRRAPKPGIARVELRARRPLSGWHGERDVAVCRRYCGDMTALRSSPMGRHDADRRASLHSGVR